jgi:hypothetical protein
MENETTDKINEEKVEESSNTLSQNEIMML